ncbi:hypothetical protein B1R32_11849 [Abditibacterium utsteinense]|uniref:Uncharacterized protein n=1 Tax=Abditibacterium utsteinense TaxID=1960156 RepID=A0A2S8SQ74_9BACT|nr:hypothetical protein B1R32_11849 [Abditibacterium utsteinense]
MVRVSQVYYYQTKLNMETNWTLCALRPKL